MGLADPASRPAAADAGTRTAFLVVGTASAPDASLVAAVADAGSAPDDPDGVPVALRVPVGVCVVRVGPGFELLNFKCLDAPQFRPREIVNQFWFGASHYKARLVAFNGRGFDLPLLELAAFRHGIAARDHYLARDRYRGPIDLLEWFTNAGAVRLPGGLDLAARLIGLPRPAPGPGVAELARHGRLREVNDRCLCDTLDTYFVFLRTRVLTGDLARDQEAALVDGAREFLAGKAAEYPALRPYLDRWGDSGSG